MPATVSIAPGGARATIEAPNGTVSTAAAPRVVVVSGGGQGQAGASSYSYVAYASDDSGTGFSLTPSPSLTYVAFKTTASPIASPAAGDFAGLWQEYKGGAASGTVTSVAVSGSDGIEVDSGSPVTSSGTIALGVNAAALSTHLGLGGAATLNVGTTPGTVAAGDHTHAQLHDAATVSGNGIAIAGQQISLDIGTGATQVAAGNHTHAQLHDAATVSGNGIAIAGQQISLDIGTGATQVAAGNHTHAQLHDAVTLAGSLDYLTLSGQQITRNAIDLATDITGTLPVANGGTGLTALGSALQVLRVNAGGTALEYAGGSGTVTSVAVSGSDGIEVDSGSPVTSSGTIALGVNAAALSTHLGLGGAATLNVGTTPGTVAAGDHTHAQLHDAATVSGNGIAIAGQQISLDIGTGATQVAAGNHTHAQLHDAATVSGNGISILGQQISLDIGTGATQVAAGNHTHAQLHDAVTLAGSLDYLTLSGQQITRNAIDLATDITGTLPVANGGTGLTALGSALQVLRVNAGGTALEYAAAAGGTEYGWKFLGSATASASAQINVDNVVTGDYDEYRIVFSSLAPATDNVTGELILRSSTPANIGGTYKAGANFAGVDTAASGGTTNVTGTAGWVIGGAVGNAAGEQLDGVAIVNLRVNSALKRMTYQAVSTNSSGQTFARAGSGSNTDTSAVAGFAFAFDSGNIASGELAVYGLKNS